MVATTTTIIVVNWTMAQRNENLTLGLNLQAQVCDNLPPTTAIVDYAIGLEKLSANEQLFDDAQLAVSL